MTNKKRVERLLKSVFATAAVLALAHSSGANFTVHRHVIQTDAKHVAGELIVKFRKGTEHWRHLAVLNLHGGKYIRNLGEPTITHVKLAQGRTVENSLDEYNNDPDVEYAEPNYIRQLMSTTPKTADFEAGQMWGFQNTGQTVGGTAVSTTDTFTAAQQGTGTTFDFLTPPFMQQTYPFASATDSSGNPPGPSAFGAFTVYGAISNGSTTITPTSMSSLQAGMNLTCTGCQSTTTVSVVNASTIVANLPATATNSRVALTFSFPYYDMNMTGAWGLSPLVAPKTTDCSNIIVAVIDSGVNYSHNDLSANMWDGQIPPCSGAGTCTGGAAQTCAAGGGGGGAPTHGCDFVANTNTPLDQLGHGTHVAGTIAAAGSTTVAHNHTGVCWTANIMALRAGDSAGSLTTSAITTAIYYAINNGAKVVNMSFGGPGSSSSEQTAMQSGESKGVLFVAAAGNAANNNDQSPTYPCSYSLSLPNVLCVGATDQSGGIASFSNFGDATVGVAGPGVNIVSTWAGLDSVYPAPSGFHTGAESTTQWGLTGPSANGGSGSGFFGDVFGTFGGVTTSHISDAAFGATGYNGSAIDIANVSFAVAGSNTTAASDTLLASSTNFVTVFNLLYDYVGLVSGDSTSINLNNSGSQASVAGSPSSNNIGTISGPESADFSLGPDSFGLSVWEGNDVGGSAYTLSETSPGFIVTSQDVSFGLSLSSAASSSGSYGVSVNTTATYFTQLQYKNSAPALATDYSVNQYHMIEGTSMATPHVVGLAALLYSTNSASTAYTYSDAIAAIKAGSVFIPNLVSKVTASGGVNAYNSMMYIAPVTGISTSYTVP